MKLMLLACALGAIGGIMEFRRPEMAYWLNIAGIALFLASVLRWLTGGRSARNWKSETDIAFPPSGIDGSSLGSGSCNTGEPGCDGGGGDGGGD